MTERGTKSPLPRRWIAGTAFGIALSLMLSGIGFYRASHSQPAPEQKHEEKVTKQNIEAKTKEWLDAFHFSVTTVPDNPKFYFGLIVRLPNEIPITIFRTKEHEDYLTFVGKIGMVKEHEDVFNKLSKDAQSEFVQELRMEAARSKISCSFDPPGFLNIEKLVPISGNLTESDLIEGIREMNYAILLIRDRVDVALTHPLQELRQPLPTPNTEASPH